jgi:hypothetical protein
MPITEAEDDEENTATLSFSLIWKSGQDSTTDNFHKISVNLRPLPFRN